MVQTVGERLILNQLNSYFMAKKNLRSKTKFKIKDVQEAYQDYNSHKEAWNKRKAVCTIIVMIMIPIASIAAMTSKYSFGDDCEGGDEGIDGLDCSLNRLTFYTCAIGPLVFSGILVFIQYFRSKNFEIKASIKLQSLEKISRFTDIKEHKSSHYIDGGSEERRLLSHVKSILDEDRETIDEKVEIEAEEEESENSGPTTIIQFVVIIILAIFVWYHVLTM